MNHAKGKIERGLHYCKCGCGYSNPAELQQHIAAWDASAEGNRLQREVADKVRHMHHNLTVERDNKRRH